MSKTIKMSLSADSVGKAIKELKAYREWVVRKTAELTERLAKIGAERAEVGFRQAAYDGVNDTEVSVEETANGWKIIASGSAVFFIEFGAGVHFNTPDPYPEPRPEGVVGIGEYGQGKGKQNTWGYYGDGGELVLTHGTPAAMPMYNAKKEMEKEIYRIAKEVFG